MSEDILKMFGMSKDGVANLTEEQATARRRADFAAMIERAETETDKMMVGLAEEMTGLVSKFIEDHHQIDNRCYIRFLNDLGTAIAMAATAGFGPSCEAHVAEGLRSAMKEMGAPPPVIDKLSGVELAASVLVNSFNSEIAGQAAVIKSGDNGAFRVTPNGK